MPLSRHFYSLDEVQAALLYTTTRNTKDESLFWCQEMLLSGCVGEAISTLFESWLWHTGPYRLQWLVDAWKTLASEELGEEDVLLATYRLSSVHYQQRDNSIWNILVLTALKPNKMPDRVTRKTPSCIPSEDEKELYFIRAIYQGKARSAWWISQYIDVERIWILLDWYAENIHTIFYTQYKVCLEALRGYEQLLGYKSDEYDVIVRCMAVLMMCIQPSVQESSFKTQSDSLDSYHKELLQEWSENIGLKRRRKYTIPTACLYGTTIRGRNQWSQQNFVQLNNIERHLIGCPFWDEALAEYADVDEKGVITWHSDDKMEEFYDQYFTDDIPDEWSKEDKLKSHGDGVLSPSDKPNIKKYSRNFMSKMPRLAWNTTKFVSNILESVDINDCSLQELAKYYNFPKHLSEQDIISLKPVRKLKIIANN